MNINLTLIGQAISFAIFVYFCMKFIWPPILEALQARSDKIAAGLSDAAKAADKLVSAKEQASILLDQTKVQARDIIEHAQKEAKSIIAEARDQATIQGAQIIKQANAEGLSQVHQSKKDLQQHFANLVLSGVEQVISRDINKQDHDAMLADLAIRV
jgi:F-type H+-transporting ATPase subunit b